MSVSALFVRALVEAIERGGARRADLLEQAAVEPERLDLVDGRFELSEFAALLERAIALTGDQAFGLHMAEQTSESAFDSLAYLVGHAPTLRDAVAISAQFRLLALDGAQISIRDSAELTTITVAFPRMTPVADRFLGELALAGFLRIARQLAAANVAPRIVAFEHARPPHHQDYARIFGGAERFRAASTSISFDREIADRSQLHQSPELYSLVRTAAERKLERIAQRSGPTDRLREYLLTRAASCIPDMATAARELGMSERSLRRHLASEKSSYRAIVRTTLEASASHMLRDPRRTIQETAAALGFVNASTFHRAFKTWTGITPKQYRERRG